MWRRCVAGAWRLESPTENACFPLATGVAHGMSRVLIPSPVPHQLEGLTQTEQMLIARALPIMTVYIKPGGQRGYSGHCVNMPQNVKELARALPRYPKDVSVILVHMKGKIAHSKIYLCVDKKFYMHYSG